MKLILTSAALATALFASISFGQTSNAKTTDCDLSDFSPTFTSTPRQSDSELTTQTQYQYKKVSTDDTNMNKIATISKGNVSSKTSSTYASDTSSTSSPVSSSNGDSVTPSSTTSDSAASSSTVDNSDSTTADKSSTPTETDKYTYSASPTDKITDSTTSATNESTKTSYDDLYDSGKGNSQDKDENDPCKVSSRDYVEGASTSWADTGYSPCCGNGSYWDNDFDSYDW